MAAPRVAKRKAPEADASPQGGEPCTKIARRAPETGNGSSSSDVVPRGADPWTRLAATGDCLSAAGRGSLSGWTLCPLCGIYSRKKHALGRGIATHLKDVHTPWNPGKLAQKIHRRQHERRQRELSNKRKDEITLESTPFQPLVAFSPTPEQLQAWDARMLEILRTIEDESTTAMRDPKDTAAGKRSRKESETLPKSEDKTGKPVIAYRDSLPPFLMAASKGDLTQLKDLVEQAKDKDKRTTDDNNEQTMGRNDHLRALLNTLDRHKSTADHWAAGGGHLDCLRYLYNLRATLVGASDHPSTGGKAPPNQQDSNNQSGAGKSTKKARRRDGKTCLHYAARNGHVPCIRYLLELGAPNEPTRETVHNRHRHSHIPHHTVDERSGEGTTPLHLACYGGHPLAVQCLVEDYGADPLATNDWGCTCSHWVAMTISDSEANVRDLCRYLSETCGLSFVEPQGQGHTALHKAAHRRNRHVIQWMVDSQSDGGAGLDPKDSAKAGAPDQGGHRPSDIWRNMGGEAGFADWMKTTMGW